MAKSDSDMCPDWNTDLEEYSASESDINIAWQMKIAVVANGLEDNSEKDPIYKNELPNRRIREAENVFLNIDRICG